MFAKLTREVVAYNYNLDQACRSWGFRLQTYKVIKAITQLTAIAAGVYAMSPDADPLVVFGLIALIWSGPEAVEYVLVNQRE